MKILLLSSDEIISYPLEISVIPPTLKFTSFLIILEDNSFIFDSKVVFKSEDDSYEFALKELLARKVEFIVLADATSFIVLSLVLIESTFHIVS